MSRLQEELLNLSSADTDVALILRTYAEIERFFQEALRAMGQGNDYHHELSNSADVTVSFRPTASSADWHGVQ